MIANFLKKVELLFTAVITKPLYGILFIALSILLFHGWLLQPDNFFIHDDFSHFLSVQNNFPVFTILPDFVYNDRPTGKILIYILWHWFGDNTVLQHGAFLLVHFFNAVLVFWLVKQMLVLLKARDESPLALSTALLFALWPRSTFTLWWISAVFDLTSTFFALLFLSFWFKFRSSQKPIYLLIVLLATLPMLRAKESAMLIPLLPLTFELILGLSSRRAQIRKLLQNQITWMAALLSSFSAVFVVRLAMLRQTTTTVRADDTFQYWTSFSPMGMLESLVRYLYLYFAIDEVGGGFTSFKPMGVLVLVVFLLSVLFVWYRRSQSRKIILLGMSGVILSFLPILPMLNNQQKLYLYLPSIFLAFLSVFVLSQLIDIFKFGVRRSEILLCLLVLVGILAVTILGGQKYDKHWWLTVGAENRKMWESLADLEPAESGDSFVLTGVDNNTNIFYYGPGDAMRLYSGQQNIFFEIHSYEVSDNDSNNYRILELKDSIVTEIH